MWLDELSPSPRKSIVQEGVLSQGMTSPHSRMLAWLD